FRNLSAPAASPKGCGGRRLRARAPVNLDRRGSDRSFRAHRKVSPQMRSPRRLLLLAAASLTVLTAASPALAQAQAQPSDPWAHATSNIPADADVRFGVMDNGMQYAILRNATPPGQASFRLRIDAGSLMEDEDQRGLAHFMEHMAFNGTTNIPENDLLRILERHGLAFGADTNAYTSFDETVYMLELPRAD